MEDNKTIYIIPKTGGKVNMDDFREQFYDLEDFISELELLSNHYKNKIDKNYIEQIDETWNQATDELKELRPIVERIENGENQEQLNEYYREAI
jgi:exonuclease VII small subunit